MQEHRGEIGGTEVEGSTIVGFSPIGDLTVLGVLMWIGLLVIEGKL